MNASPSKQIAESNTPSKAAEDEIDLREIAASSAATAADSGHRNCLIGAERLHAYTNLFGRQVQIVLDQQTQT